MLDKFDELRRQWYKPRVNSWEEPLNAFFTLPRIAQFLEEEMKLSSEEITEVYKMEFKGGGEREILIPECLWKGRKEEWTAIAKKFNNKYMCCDFYLINYNKTEIKITNVAGDIKIAVPKQKKQDLESL